MQVLLTMSRDVCPREVQELSKTLGVRTVAIGVKRETEFTPLREDSGSVSKHWGELVGKR